MFVRAGVGISLLGSLGCRAPPFSLVRLSMMRATQLHRSNQANAVRVQAIAVPGEILDHGTDFGRRIAGRCGHMLDCFAAPCDPLPDRFVAIDIQQRS